MILFVVVGMPASGKNIAREYAESKGIPYFATGDAVRNEVKRRGLTPDAENTAAVSTELRGPDGMGVTRHTLSAVFETERDIAFMEGMRSWPEIELIRTHTACIVIAFIAPRGLRRERITSRARPDDSPDAFDDRDMREITYGTAAPIALADDYILNTGSMEDTINSLDNMVRKYSGDHTARKS